jgi:hypothetical protein
MRRHLAPFDILPAILLVSASATADSWIFQPSLYSHDPGTCQRVNQFQPERPTFAREDPTYMESGYRHLHSSILGPGGMYDQTHVVQTWGAGEMIRPYGEWEFPFRAGATPFGPWGNPQGPWTLPFDSWQNPYGLWNQMRPPFWSFPGGPVTPRPLPTPIGGSSSFGSTPGPGFGAGYGSGPDYGPGYGGGGSTPYSPPTPPGPGYP